jgi:hypothetical protein
MKRMTRKEVISMDTQRATCLEAYCPKAVFHVETEPVRATELAKKLRQHAELIKQAAAARAKWIQLCADERALNTQLAPIVDVAAHYVTNVFGTGSEVYIDFGLADVTAAVPTVEEKLVAVKKRAATRDARHTMGKKQKLKIRGDAVLSSASAPVAPVAVAATTNGTSAPQQAAAPVTPAAQANGVAH